ncbi:MAG: hypothetical protein Q9187_008068, partial [Circinaria calcarea]
MEFQIRITCYYFRYSLSRYVRDLITLDNWREMQTAINKSHKHIEDNLKEIGNVYLDNALAEQPEKLQEFAQE